MARRVSKCSVASLAAFVVLSACGRTGLWKGELTLVWLDAEGHERRSNSASTAPGLLDFGAVEASAGRPVWVENTGLGPLEFEQVEPLTPDAPFRATFTPARLLRRERQRIELIFEPTQPASSAEAVFRFSGSNVELPSEGVADLRVMGIRPAIFPDLEVAPFPVLELGPIAWRPGAEAQATSVIEVRNVGGSPLLLSLPWTVTSASSPLDELCVGVRDASGSCRAELPTPVAASGLLPNERVALPVQVNARTPGRKAWTLTLASNDPDEPVVAIEIVADVVETPLCEVELRPGALDFGLLRTTPRELLLEIANRSATVPCEVSAIQLMPGSHPAFSIVGSPAPLQVAPSGSQFVTVRAWNGVVSASREDLSGAIEVVVDNALTPPVPVPLSAALGRGCLLLGPADVDFGSVQVGCATAERIVSVVNVCERPVILQAVGLGMSASSEMQLAAAPALPRTLMPAERTSLSVKYRPVDVGEDRGALRLEASFDGAQLTEVGLLKGRGARTPDNVDVFQQGDILADVLMVVDDSCSMSDKQAELAANLGLFLEELRPRRVDFRVGVVGMTFLPDGGAPPFRTTPSGQAFLEPSTPALESVFRQMVSVGTSGDVDAESCARPAAAALAGGRHFLRDGAPLSVICVTDEDEQAPQPVELSYGALAQLRPTFSYNVVGPGPTCSMPTQFAGRHEALVAMTGGVFQPICTPQWGRSLAQVGAAVAGVRAAFPLRSLPSSGIVVRVDGVEVPSIDARGARTWTWDAAANAVQFTDLFVPEYGAVIEVAYQVACR